jgi:homoserine O-succinyltransferase
MVIESQVTGVRISDRSSTPRSTNRTVLTVGFVNNMPDSAFEATYRQFAGLLRAGASGFTVDLRGYCLPHPPRSESIRNAASLQYEDTACLFANPPDALIVTGSEPRSTNLANEPFWEDLVHLLRWAETTVPSTILSCLASHAVVLALDGIARTPLPAKQSGVFQQDVDADHPLGRGLERVVSFPHSRYNDIPASALNARYRLVVASPLSGWTVATRQNEGRVFVLLQGHPEYGPLTLLKEYRRDVNRFLDGTYPTHPAIPVDYLDATGIELLDSFRSICESRSTASIDDFPYEEAAQHICFGWERASTRLFTNWIVDAATRSAQVAS